MQDIADIRNLLEELFSHVDIERRRVSSSINYYDVFFSYRLKRFHMVLGERLGGFVVLSVSLSRAFDALFTESVRRYIRTHYIDQQYSNQCRAKYGGKFCVCPG